MLTVPDLSTNPPATTAAVYLWDGQAFDRFTAYYVDHVIKDSISDSRHGDNMYLHCNT